MKKILVLIMVVAMACLALFACTPAATTEPPMTDGLEGKTPTDASVFKYEEMSDGTIKITGVYTQETGLTSLVIPASIDGKNVTVIGETALATLYTVEELVLPNYVKEIQPYAFRDCTSLKTVKLSQTLETIGEGAFQGCTALTELNFIPASVKTLGNRAFEGCAGLVSATIPDSVEDIGTYMFVGCKALTTVTLPAGIESLPARMFQDCDALTDLSVVPATVKKLGALMFEGCDGLTNVVIPDHIEKIGANAFANCSKLASVTFSANMTDIPKNTFANCDALVEMVIPANIKTVGDSVFEGCDALTKVEFGENVETVGVNTFTNCLVLVEVKFSPKMTAIPAGMFDGCKKLKNTVGDTGFVIPANIKTIGDVAFRGCNGGLENITFSEGIEKIGDNAFDFCQKAKKITLPSTIKSIGKEAFTQCTRLVTVEMVIAPDATIGENVFLNTKKINSITVKAGSTAETYAQSWITTISKLSGYAKITVTKK